MLDALNLRDELRQTLAAVYNVIGDVQFSEIYNESEPTNWEYSPEIEDVHPHYIGKRRLRLM